MTMPASRSAFTFGAFGQLWWLPSDGLGNGLDDAESTLLTLMPWLSSAPAGDSEGTQSGGGDRAWR